MSQDVRCIILPSLRTHVPGVSSLEPKPTWHLPIHIYTDKGIDLDFGPLLLFDEALVDTAGFEYIASSNRPELAPLLLSLRELEAAGYVKFVDFGSKLDDVRDHITDHVARLTADPLPLREPVLRGIGGYRSTVSAQMSSGVQHDASVLDIGFGMHMRLLRGCGTLDAEEQARLDRLMVSRKQRWTQRDLADVRSLVSPTVTYLYQNLVLGELLGAPFLDVRYTQEMYQLVRDRTLLAFSSKASAQTQEIATAQQLFECAIPELRPTSAKDILTLLRSSAVRDFRDYVFEAAKNGNCMSREEYVTLLRASLAAEQRASRVGARIAWIERAVSLVPVPGISLIAAGVAAIATRVHRSRREPRQNWLYALLDGQKDIACDSNTTRSQKETKA